MVAVGQVMPNRVCVDRKTRGAARGRVGFWLSQPVRPRRAHASEDEYLLSLYFPSWSCIKCISRLVKCSALPSACCNNASKASMSLMTVRPPGVSLQRSMHLPCRAVSLLILGVVKVILLNVWDLDCFSC